MLLRNQLRVTALATIIGGIEDGQDVGLGRGAPALNCLLPEHRGVSRIKQIKTVDQQQPHPSSNRSAPGPRELWGWAGLCGSRISYTGPG